MKTQKFFLSNSGNLMVGGTKNSFFMTSAGEFIRLVGKEEEEYLTGVMPQIEFVDRNQPSLPEIPLWFYLWTTSHEDESNYYGPHSDTGGKYADISTTHYFFRKNGKKNEFCKLMYTKSSGSFFQTSSGHCAKKHECSEMFIIGVEEQEDFRWVEEGKETDGGDIVLDQISEPCKLKDALMAANSGVTSRYDSDGCSTQKPEYWKDGIDQMLEERLGVLRSLGMQNPERVLQPKRGGR